MAEVQAMQLYCNRIKLKVGTDYSEAIGTFDGQIDGGDDQTGRGEEVWGVQYNESEIPLLEAAYASDLEIDFLGSKAVIRKAYDAWQKRDDDEDERGLASVGTWLPAGFEFFGAPGHEEFMFAAIILFNRLISGETHVKFFQPVVRYSSNVGRQFTTPKPIPGRPKVYASTAALSAALPIPGTVLFELPDFGAWLEHPPQVQRTTGDRTDISQNWEWFERISFIAYPQD